MELLRQGRPLRPETTEIVTTLESVVRRDPTHAWAIHRYIHATESSDHPARAEHYADTLTSLVPGAGHLVHMPAHLPAHRPLSRRRARQRAGDGRRQLLYLAVPPEGLDYQAGSGTTPAAGRLSVPASSTVQQLSSRP